MTFRVGQKVVCIDDGDDPGLPAGEQSDWTPDERPIMGHIYTVRRCFIARGNLILHLDEIARSATAQETWGPDVGYGAFRFRPLAEKKTDTGFAILEEIRRRESIPQNERIKSIV